MDRGEIWLVSLDPIAGHEQSGKRPVLIVSKASFNKLTRLPVVVPVTSGGNFARTAGFTVSLEEAGTKQRALFAATSPEPLIWLPGTASGWNAYLTPL
jgi:mRNA interferase ChpB